MYKILFFLLLSSYLLTAQESANYTIQIGEETFDYVLGSDFEYTAKKKGPITISIKQKDILTYNDGIVSFEHPISFPVSETALEEGIKQIVAISSTGSGVIIQEYQGVNPELMVDLMLNEVTKESIQYGYEEATESVEYKTANNKVLKGKKSILSYQGAKDEWAGDAYGWKDGGILIATMIIDSGGEFDNSSYIHSFFDTLKIHTK